jgi:hypothetical protein
MPKATLYPPGDTLQKAIKDYSEQLLAHPEKERWQLLQEIELKYDLNPKECEFLNRHFKTA